MSGQFVDVWTDGSWRHNHGVGGAGWVIRATDGKLSEGHIRLPPMKQDFHPHGSDIAEIAAAGYALRSVPRHSRVRLYMDCANVIDWLNAREIITYSKRVPPLIDHFDRAVDLIQGMNQVHIIQIGGSNLNHGKAHTLARTASTPGRG